MNVYITNIINNEENEKVSKSAKELGFKELSLIKDVNIHMLDSLIKEQLIKVNCKDVVIVQLPLSDSKEFEDVLFESLKEKNVKIVCFIHEYEKKYSRLYSMADCLLIDEKNKNYVNNDKVIWFKNDSEFYIKKALLESVNLFIEEDGSDKCIHIAFGLHDKSGDYSVLVGVAMQSIIDHTNAQICFHVLHDETLNEENRCKLSKVAKNGYCLIEFHLIDIKVFDQIASQVKGYTIGSVFRILIPDLLKYLNKVLYLDADLFVNLDIEELWNIDIDEYCIGAVQDMNVANHRVTPLPIHLEEMEYDEYFNSGVLLMNLIEIQKNGDMKQKIVDYLLEHNESDLPDQDALNVVYREKTKFLDSKYNWFVRNARSNHELKLENKIYHYVGTNCILYHLNEVDYFYILTMLKINWRIENINQIIKNSFVRMNDRILQYEKMIQCYSNQDKIRVICCESFYVDQLYSSLGKKYGDIVVLDLSSLEFAILKLRKENKKFLILLSASINNGIDLLERYGLKNGEDFFIIQRFLSNLNGGFI